VQHRQVFGQGSCGPCCAIGPPTSSPAASHASCGHAWLRAAATAFVCAKPHRDMRGGLGYTTFETVRGSSSRTTSDQGRAAPKAAPRLARAQLPSMGIPGLRRFCAGDAYCARRQTIRWGAPVRASATPPRVG
jgi:hypothetical protein